MCGALAVAELLPTPPGGSGLNLPLGCKRRVEKHRRLPQQTEQEASEIGDSVDTTIQASVQFAEESAQPKPEALFTNIYAEPDKD